MTSLAKRMWVAAETLEEVSAFIGSKNPDCMNWSAKALRHESGFVAAEQHTTAKCLVCGGKVWCTDGGMVRQHMVSESSVWCSASGQPFDVLAAVTA